jgi:CheY-like chemotaxis protein
MIVEDEPDNREIIRAVVEDLLGYRAMLVPDGSVAVQTAIEARPDLVLMDLMTPVLDGFQAIKQLKSRDETAHIPVVAVTALSRAIDRQRALEEGADGYISKPFDLDELVAVIRRFVGEGVA